MLQAGLRVGEVAMLGMADITISDRSGSVRIRHGKGLKAREVPLNATARRALRQFLEGRPTPPKKTDTPLFVSSRDTAMRPVRLRGTENRHKEDWSSIAALCATNWS